MRFVAESFRRHAATWGLMGIVMVVVLLCGTPSAFAKKSKKPKVPQEKSFLIKQIESRQKGITYAGWVDSQTTHTELKTFCQEFIAREQGEISTLAGWLQAWYPATPAPAAHSSSNRGRVEDSDDDDDDDEPEFEFAFDLKALSKFKELDKKENSSMKEGKKKVVHAELKAFLLDTRTINEQEIGLLKGWIIMLEDFKDDNDDQDEDDD